MADAKIEVRRCTSVLCFNTHQTFACLAMPLNTKAVRFVRHLCALILADLIL